MPKAKRFTEDDVTLRPEYHDNRWERCRYCGCDGDLRWGTCFPCAMGNRIQRWWHRQAVRLGWTKSHGH